MKTGKRSLIDIERQIKELHEERDRLTVVSKLTSSMIKSESLRDLKYFIAQRLDPSTMDLAPYILSVTMRKTRHPELMSLNFTYQGQMYCVRYNDAQVKVIHDTYSRSYRFSFGANCQLIEYPEKELPTKPALFTVAHVTKIIEDMQVAGVVFSHLVSFLTSKFSRYEIDERYYGALEDFANLPIIETRRVICNVIRGSYYSRDTRRLICRAIWDLTQTIGFDSKK
jgi:hypothetical protein